MATFIQQMADQVAGMVTFGLPDCNGGAVTIDGFLIEDPSISLKNNFESIIPDLQGVNDFMQLANIDTTSWLSTSKMAWKGTDPMTVTFNFYLLTWSKDQLTGAKMPISKEASYFARLLAVSPGGTSGLSETLGVTVHGGYRPDYFQRNNEFKIPSTVTAEKFQEVDFYHADTNGTCTIVVNGGGNRTLTFTKMLLTDATFTPSTVRAGYWSGDINKGNPNTFIKSKEPLYIRISASFKLMHATTVEDATRLFTGGTTL